MITAGFSYTSSCAITLWAEKNTKIKSKNSLYFFIKFIFINLILVSAEEAYSQLTLENIFLTNKYSAVQANNIVFLHQQPLFAKLTTSARKTLVSFYNKKNEKTQEWLLTSPAGYKTTEWRDLIISNTDNFFLAGCNYEQLYRRSFLCNYFWSDKNGILTALSDEKQLYPVFSPNDKKIAFIKNNNIFYKEIATNTEIQITKDGEWNKIINRIPDSIVL